MLLRRPFFYRITNILVYVTERVELASAVLRNWKKTHILAYYLYKKQKKTEKRKRSMWVHHILLKKNKCDALQILKLSSEVGVGKR